MAGSRAVSAREPGQIREEAALSGPAHAPRTSLAGAEDRRARPKTDFDEGCTVHYSNMGDEQRNLEVVTRIAELWNAGDLEGLLALYDDDVEVVTDPGWPEGSTRGKEAFANTSREWREAWERIDVTAGDLRPIGSERVLAEGSWDSRGAASGIAGRLEFAILYTLRDGLVVCQQWFLDKTEARRAAGLG